MHFPFTSESQKALRGMQAKHVAIISWSPNATTSPIAICEANFAYPVVKIRRYPRTILILASVIPMPYIMMDAQKNCCQSS